MEWAARVWRPKTARKEQLEAEQRSSPSGAVVYKAVLKEGMMNWRALRRPCFGRAWQRAFRWGRRSSRAQDRISGKHCLAAGFTLSAEPPGDARLVQIIRRHLHLHAVPDCQSYPPLAHFAANGGEHQVLVVQLDTEHRAWEDNRNDAFYFNMLFFCLNHSVFSGA